MRSEWRAKKKLTIAFRACLSGAPKCTCSLGIAGVIEGLGDETFFIDECVKCFIEKNPPLPISGVHPFGLYRNYEKGLLLQAGGWIDQPAIYCETIDLLCALMQDHESKQRDKQKAEMDRMKNGVKTKRFGHGR